MSSSIQNIGGSMRSSLRPDPAQIANTLFTKLDANNVGYIEKTDLQSAVDRLNGTGKSTDTTSAVEDLFTKLDGDSDGKVTKQELTDGMKNLAAQLDQQFDQSRVANNSSSRKANRISAFAETIFSQIDTQNKGYIDKTALASALGQTSDSASSSNVDDLFKKLDGDGDGKITKRELSDGMQKIADERDQHFSSLAASRTRGAGDVPSSRDEIGGIAGKSNATAGGGATSIIEKADTNQDGKITIAEQIAYDSKTKSDNASKAIDDQATDSQPRNNTASKAGSSAIAAMRLMTQLMQAYGGDFADFARANSSSTISIQT